jgi:hypothetical protein
MSVGPTVFVGETYGLAGKLQTRPAPFFYGFVRRPAWSNWVSGGQETTEYPLVFQIPASRWTNPPPSNLTQITVAL